MVAQFAEHKAAIVKRREARDVANQLLGAMGAMEATDLLATLRFDLAPADLQSLLTFTAYLTKRIEDRINGYNPAGSAV